MEVKEFKKSKILVTGASGFVGARVMQKYSFAKAIPSELYRLAGEGLKDYIMAEAPEVVINCAAISDISTCEKNADGSRLANVDLPVALAKACKDVGAKLISFSSDQVYTGCLSQGPYSESDNLPQPTNVYARHKLEAEARVLDILPSAVMLRATWMYDMPINNHNNRGNFLVNVLNCLSSKTTISFSSKQYRGITYVKEVVELLEKATFLEGGVYNYGSENPLDAYSTALALVNALGRESESFLIEDGKENRHNLWMDTSKLKSKGVSFQTTIEGIKSCVSNYGLEKYLKS